MHLKRKAEKNGVVSIPGIGMGVGVSLLISLLLTVALASLVVNEKMSYGASVWGMLTINLISVALGCLTAKRFAENDRIIVCGAVTAVYLMIRFGVAVLLLDGNMERPILTVLSAGVGALLSAALMLNRKTRRGFKRKHYC